MLTPDGFLLTSAHVIVELGGERIEGVEDIQRLMVADLIGSEVDIVVLRAGSPRRPPLRVRELSS